ncbi:MAG TPA: rhomboid family intramembrane serine protease [Blastocatellia bacterium]|nr:rhomboid family intramembrane serine protease [Blastocatellia bacterium]
MFTGLFLLIILFLVLFSMFIPIGNENSTVRRLPWITFGIMALNVLIYYVTLPGNVTHLRDIAKEQAKLEELLTREPRLIGDEGVRKKLKEIGLASDSDLEEAEKAFKENDAALKEAQYYLSTKPGMAARAEFDNICTSLMKALESTLWYKYGVAPNGKWKFYQLITAAFLHGDTMHLFGNMIFFFAVAFSLEDLWGRSTFTAFYLFGAIAASLPSIVMPESVPGIGASGAISATMGAFLVRLPRAKIKLLFFLFPFSLIYFLIKKKGLVIHLPGYIYLIAYFVAQLLLWGIDKLSGETSNVGYTVHMAGFAYGALFAVVMKGMRAEELYINPKIEAKVSFAAPQAVSQALEALDRGDVGIAERKLKSHMVSNPNDVEAIMALIQVYQHTLNYEQLNAAYGRLIRHHLGNNDLEAALYTYDNLLSAFPDDQVAPRIAARDWLPLCEYLREMGMTREAAVEYERLAKAQPDDPLTSRACVQGGEAALIANDLERALRLFEQAQTKNIPVALAGRIEAGLEKCRQRLASRPRWVKKTPTAHDMLRTARPDATTFDEKKFPL